MKVIGTKHLEAVKSVGLKAIDPKNIDFVKGAGLQHVRGATGFLTEFKDFLNEYKVIGLAVAFVMGATSTTLIKSLVDNIIMPLITPFVPGGAWKTATIAIGPFIIGWGPFTAELINFIIVAFAVFIIAKKVLGETKVTKK